MSVKFYKKVQMNPTSNISVSKMRLICVLLNEIF